MSAIYPSAENTSSSFLSPCITNAGIKPMFPLNSGAGNSASQISLGGSTVACTTEGDIMLTSQESITSIASNNIGLFTSSGDISISAGGGINLYSTPSGFSSGQQLPLEPDGSLRAAKITAPLILCQEIKPSENGTIDIDSNNGPIDITGGTINIKSSNLNFNDLPYNACSLAGMAILFPDTTPSPSGPRDYFIKIPDFPELTDKAPVSVFRNYTDIADIGNLADIIRAIVTFGTADPNSQYIRVGISKPLSSNMLVSWNVSLPDCVYTPAIRAIP